MFRHGNSRGAAPHKSFPTFAEENFEPHSKAQHKPPGQRRHLGRTEGLGGHRTWCSSSRVDPRGAGPSLLAPGSRVTCTTEEALRLFHKQQKRL